MLKFPPVDLCISVMILSRHMGALTNIRTVYNLLQLLYQAFRMSFFFAGASRKKVFLSRAIDFYLYQYLHAHIILKVFRLLTWLTN